MLRPIAASLRPAARLAGRRQASGSALVSSDIEKELTAAGMTKLIAPGIAHGREAFVWDVPKDLPENDFIKRRKAVAAHAFETTELWRKISVYICLPGVLITTYWVYKAEKAHEEHHKHVVEMNGGVEPERKVYAYMNIRTKPFPWGNQSLFFNPKVNIPVDE